MFLVMMSRTFEFRISTAGRKELAELASRRRGNQEPALVRECATSRPKKDAQSGSAGKTSSDAVLRLGHNKEPRRSGARAYSGPFRGCRGAKTVPLALSHACHRAHRRDCDGHHNLCDLRPARGAAERALYG